MAFIEAPRFPDTLAFGATGGPRYNTQVVVTQGGRESRNQQWTHPLRVYDVGLVHKTEAETLLLVAFFRAVAQGKANGFRFKDFGAGESQGLDEPLGTGTGSSADYQLMKRYTVESETYDRPITKPVAGSVMVKVNGVATGSFSVDTTTGIVTMSATNGAVLTATYLFDVGVRFDSDWLPIRRVDPNVYSWESIRLYEERIIV